MSRFLFLALSISVGFLVRGVEGGVAHKAEWRWKPGSVLRVKFLGGDGAVRVLVMAAAKEWEASANVRFREVDEGFAEVRVAFDSRFGCWAYPGLSALNFAQDQATTNLGWITPTTEWKEVRRVVLHEFGHVLGLVHEHQNVAVPFRWDFEKTYAHYRTPPWGWKDERILRDVVGRFRETDVDHSQFDADSVMAYPIAKTCLAAGSAKETQNWSLSAGDREFIAMLYPRGEVLAVREHRLPSRESFTKLAATQVPPRPALYGPRDMLPWAVAYLLGAFRRGS